MTAAASPPIATPAVLASVASAKSAVERARGKLADVERSFAHGVADRAALTSAERAFRDAEIRLREAERLEEERAAAQRREATERFRERSAYVTAGQLDELAAICEVVADELVHLEVQTLERVQAHLKKVKQAAYDAERLTEAAPELGGHAAFDRAVAKLHRHADDADLRALRLVRDAVARKLRAVGYARIPLLVQRFADGAADAAQPRR